MLAAMSKIVGQADAAARRKRPPWAFIALTVVWAILLVPVTVFSAMTGLLADGPGSASRIATVVYLFLAWPVLLVAAVAGAWVAYRVNKPRLAWACMAVPAVWPLVPSLAMAILLSDPMSGKGCRGITAESAKAKVLHAKVSMLARSTPEYQREYADSTIKSLDIGPDVNGRGFAAEVIFAHPDKRSLIAFVYDDCDLKWGYGE